MCRCPQRLEEGARSLATGVTGIHELGSELGSSGKSLKSSYLTIHLFSPERKIQEVKKQNKTKNRNARFLQKN